MKKVIAFALLICVISLTFISCQNAEDAFGDKAIRVKVSHISGFEVEEEYDLYFENIKIGERNSLPNGDANPSYKVDFTIADMTKEGLTISFSQPMDKTDGDDTGKWQLEQESFVIRIGESQRFITPTDGGGDSFEFTIVDKSEIPSTN